MGGIMRKRIMGITTIMFLATVTNLLAQDLEREPHPYFDIETIEVQALPLEAGVDFDYKDNYVSERESLKSLPQVIAAVDGLIALGERIWPIIEAGRPVSNARFNQVDVLPDGTRAMDLEGWQPPKGLRWRVVYKNFYGMEVIAFNYAVLFQYAGNVDGRGRYLTGVFVEASNVSVSWGFDFNATSEVMTISNVGTKTNPVASLMLRINYQAKSVLRDITNQKTVYVTGLGQISDL